MLRQSHLSGRTTSTSNTNAGCKKANAFPPSQAINTLLNPGRHATCKIHLVRSVGDGAARCPPYNYDAPDNGNRLSRKGQTAPAQVMEKSNSSPRRNLQTLSQLKSTNAAVTINSSTLALNSGNLPSYLTTLHPLGQNSTKLDSRKSDCSFYT